MSRSFIVACAILALASVAGISSLAAEAGGPRSHPRLGTGKARPHARPPRLSLGKPIPADLPELPRMTPDPRATSSDAAPSATAGRRFTVGPVTISPGGFLAGDGRMR